MSSFEIDHPSEAQTAMHIDLITESDDNVIVSVPECYMRKKASDLDTSGREQVTHRYRSFYSRR